MEIQIKVGDTEKMTGKFIVIEGIDGSGKTTIANLLCDKLNQKFKAIDVSKKSIEADSQYVKQFMKNIKKSLWESSSTDPVSQIDEESWLYLHILWYHLLQKQIIEKKLMDYNYVVTDGWFYKFWARHLTNMLNGDTDFSKGLIQRLMSGDERILLDVSPQECFRRKQNVKPSEMGIHGVVSGKTNYEKFVSYQSNVQQKYYEIADEYNFRRIDASPPPEKIVDKLWRMVI